ncbi:hypothetical protein NA57DRAFT_60748 [Rhizodiscina lignyota]|uniref:Uncharacterized protein n=1 Tax=Rhizodiscina lignyota TaxID=1504668 RepID=A0A9P4M5S2_9PEZI|nr:hypothetical protein NA57DRAFT_60748 [Rhizodiscina lignyota]
MDIDATKYKQRVEDKSTGKVKELEGPDSVNGTNSVTITTNPYTAETDGTEKTKTKEGAAKTFDVKPDFPACKRCVGANELGKSSKLGRKCFSLFPPSTGLADTNLSSFSACPGLRCRSPERSGTVFPSGTPARLQKVWKVAIVQHEKAKSVQLAATLISRRTLVRFLVALLPISSFAGCHPTTSTATQSVSPGRDRCERLDRGNCNGHMEKSKSSEHPLSQDAVV